MRGDNNGHSFLNLNGYNFVPIEKDSANTIMYAVDRRISKVELLNWLREYSSTN